MNISIIVKDHIANCKDREPIFVNDVKVPSQCYNARNITFFRLEKENKIRKFKKGIYYKPKITIFGELGIDIQQLIVRKYIKVDNEINGYITGPWLWNNLGITTQVLIRRWIATNLTNKTTEKKELNIKLIKPKTTINKNNFEFLQLLDLIDQTYKIQDIKMLVNTRKYQKLHNEILNLKIKANTGKKHKLIYKI